MPRRRNRNDELDFEIHVDDSCRPEAMNDGPSPFESAEHLESTMDHESFTDEPRLGSESSDATVMNSIEAEETEFSRRRESGLSNVSYESDRRPSSRQGSNRPPRDSWSVSEGRQSMAGSERAGGRVSAGGSSSQQEHEDDVFSDHSPRSSTGSNIDADQLKQAHTDSRRTTEGSRISDIQPYDPEEEFVPTVRETPRPPFRSPSSVRAMQMNSPPPSVSGSGRRANRSSVSRIGSPAVSTQFSPKKTPPRFKRNTPPLVLLHVTLLPLRWPWGDLMDNARPSELSDAGKNLREAWKQLQARVGDTVSDRGVLLPHPQNDFEILEERLLEAMDLPLRRRARILECGHYLGPANEMGLAEDEMASDDEEFGSKAPDGDQRHWCSTCQSEIRYDSLGEGKIFRTKVYASNGLMKAGAWDACWKEMERVDVELEPIVDPSVLDELERIAATQEREAIEAEIAASAHMADESEEDHIPFAEEEGVSFDAPPQEESEREAYEQRMREVYGEGPAAEAAFRADQAVQAAARIRSETRRSLNELIRGDPQPSIWADTIRYGLRDLMQLVACVVTVYVLQYFGIGLDKKDKGGDLVKSPGSAKTPVLQERAAIVTASSEPIASTARRNLESVQDSYAACTSALEAVQVSLALATAAATETITVTETVSITAAEETGTPEEHGEVKPDAVEGAETVKSQEDAPLHTAESVDEEDADAQDMEDEPAPDVSPESDEKTEL